MKKNSFSATSKTRLESCYEDLQRLFNAVLQEQDCSILCGFRGEAEQNAAFASGNSKAKWPQSSHNTSPSLAVDVAPYPINWQDLAGFDSFAIIVKRKAVELGIVIYWGGDFKSIVDKPHWSLNGK
jgi:peptidoglycan LD-endopeptidase CwlK